jgi:hypothetical protein
MYAKNLKYWKSIALVIFAAATPTSAQTTNLICDGTIASEVLVIGRGIIEQPKPVEKSNSYHFLNGRLLAPESTDTRPVYAWMHCDWTQSEITCTQPDLDNQCVDARAKGVIPPELSACRTSLKINRFSGFVHDERWNYTERFGPFGPSIWGQTFKGKCGLDSKRKF